MLLLNLTDFGGSSETINHSSYIGLISGYICLNTMKYVSFKRKLTHMLFQKLFISILMLFFIISETDID